MCRLLTADALAGETERLRVRIAQLFDRIETQLRQVLRESELKQAMRPAMEATLVRITYWHYWRKIRQYVRTEFKTKPTQAGGNNGRIIAPKAMIDHD